MGTLRRWQHLLQQSVPDLAEEPVAKLGLAATPEKVEKSLVKLSQKRPKNATFLTGVMTCAARAEPIRVSRRSPMLTIPSPLCD